MAETGYFAWERPEVAALLEPRGPILDVGCAEGRLCQGMAASGIRVVGIEPHAAAATQARARYAEVHAGTIADFTSEERFAQVVFADVLEHVEDPWGTLRRVTQDLLMPDGRVILSIPNVRHWTVVRDLVVRGRWEYVDAGLLDRTHLRFFTRRSCLGLARGAGLEVELVEPRFERRLTRLLSSGSFGLLEEFLALQWLLVGRRRTRS